MMIFSVAFQMSFFFFFFLIQEINERVCETLGIIVVKVLSCLHIKSVSDRWVMSVDHSFQWSSKSKLIKSLKYVWYESIILIITKLLKRKKKKDKAKKMQLWWSHKNVKGQLQVIDVNKHLVLRLLIVSPVTESSILQTITGMVTMIDVVRVLTK